MRDTNLLGICAIALAILALAWQRYPRVLGIFTLLTLFVLGLCFLLSR